MSRLAKKPIVIPQGVQASLVNGLFAVKGPKGDLKKDFKPLINIAIANNEIVLSKNRDTIETKALVGTYASHIMNMIEGVVKGFEKKLIIEGVGYKAEVKGPKLVMSLGFSHQVPIDIPKDLVVTSEKGIITISGINKESVGEFAAKIRANKKPEPYKGKGIRYEKEVIKRKQGKKTV